MERRILCSADSLLMVSSALAQPFVYMGVPRERITVLPNGVDATRFDPTLSGTEIRRAHDLVGKHVIGFVGNRRPWHDLDTVLDSMKLLGERGLDVRLFLVGEQFEQEIAKGGDLVRSIRVSADEVPIHLAAMDVVVVPYDHTADTYFSPLKLFEAMAMAKPVVGAAVGQVDEVLRHGSNGLIYEPGDAADLAGKIGQILTSADRGDAMGLAAREDVLANYTWDANARQIAEASRARNVSDAPLEDALV
jgi:glycosyltransferase involved in cell wall biosynthesis